MSACPACWSQMSFIEQCQQWYCYNCRAYRQPQQPPPPPPPTQQQYGQPAAQQQPPPVQPQHYQQPVQQQQYSPAQQQYGAPQYAVYGQQQKTASAYYIAIAALIFAFLGGLIGIILGAVAVWLASKQLAQGMPKAKTAQTLGKAAVVIGAWVMVIIVIIITW
jgi:hypothetical protein